ncbi:hypothetical protein, partial [Natrinema sp. JCM 9743]
ISIHSTDTAQLLGLEVGIIEDNRYTGRDKNKPVLVPKIEIQEMVERPVNDSRSSLAVPASTAC